MTEKFIELTEIEGGNGGDDRKVLINLRAVSHIVPDITDKDTTVVHFNEEEYLLVRESYDQVIKILGWGET